MADDDNKPDYEIFALYLATAEKVTDRRGATNQWLLSVNSAIVGLYGYITATGGLSEGERAVWTWAIPASGMIVCIAWVAMLENYRKLNAAKFGVLNDVERALGLDLFAKEHALYKKEGRGAMSNLEKAVPWSFLVLFGLLVVAAIMPLPQP